MESWENPGASLEWKKHPRNDRRERFTTVETSKKVDI
jgi:hypothetical protein